MSLDLEWVTGLFTAYGRLWNRNSILGDIFGRTNIEIDQLSFGMRRGVAHALFLGRILFFRSSIPSRCGFEEIKLLGFEKYSIGSSKLITRRARGGIPGDS